MAETPSNSPLLPSSGNTATSAPQNGPNLSQEVRSRMPGLEGAIEVASQQPQGGGTDGVVTTQKKSLTEAEAIVQPNITASREAEALSDGLLLRETRKKIQDLLSNLDKKANRVKHSSSASKASNFARIVANMRQLNISLGTLYRMSLDKVRDLYTQLR